MIDPIDFKGKAWKKFSYWNTKVGEMFPRIGMQLRKSASYIFKLQVQINDLKEEVDELRRRIGES